jgi:glycosyltransferase involved in cell wall biosynthesis
MTRLVCLLPARNAAGDLPGWLDGVRGWVDAVVALDDGSTDETAELLTADPLVRVLLRNPRRESYAGWDDATNRSRLLDAAAELEPEWMLFLDADERIPPDDARALREFLDTDALPGLAYGFRVHRLINDTEHFDKANLWVYRLFAWEPGQRLPELRHHLVPVPTAIGPERLVNTTIRILHLSGLDEGRRRARLDKWLEVDPDHEFQADYGHLVASPGELHHIAARPPGLPVLAGGDPVARPVPDVDAPVLSAIVIAQDDEDTIERSLRTVVEQQCSQAFEVIVVTSGRDRTASIVRAKFPNVRHVEFPSPVLPGAARNAGLHIARGDYVSFPGSHVELPPGSLDARLHAHLAGWEMVTGTMLNGTLTRAGWASYFLDHSGVLPGRPSGELSMPPAHCSYTRHVLEEVGGFPEDRRAGEDTAVNFDLFRRGYRAYRAADVELFHHTRCATVPRLLEHHYGRGRAWGRMLLDEAGDRRTLLRTSWREVFGYVPLRWQRLRANVRAWSGPLWEQYHRAEPLAGLAIGAAFAGMVHEATTWRASDDVHATDGEVQLGFGPVFVHAPKTAGTAFRRTLGDQYGIDRVLELYGTLGPDEIERLRQIDARDWGALRAVTGHMEFGLHELIPFPVRYVTLLRDPVDRIVSHYFYARTTPELPGRDRDLAGVDDLESYVTASASAPWFNDGQTRYLGGDFTAGTPPATRATFERAKRNLREHFAVVGLAERYPEFLLLVRRAFGWDWPRCEVVNATLDRPQLDEIPASSRELIREKNSLDVELHAFARELFEEQLSAYGPGLTDDLAYLGERSRARSEADELVARGR